MNKESFDKLLNKILSAILIILVCIICLFLNSSGFGYYLTYPLKFLFGMNYWIIAAILIAYSLAVIFYDFKKNKFKLRFILIGLSIAFVGLLILNSYGFETDQNYIKGLTQRFIDTFKNYKSDTLLNYVSTLKIENGGYIGHLLYCLIAQLFSLNAPFVVALLMMVFGAVSGFVYTLIFCLKNTKKPHLKSKKHKKEVNEVLADNSFNLEPNKPLLEPFDDSIFLENNKVVRDEAINESAFIEKDILDSDVEIKKSTAKSGTFNVFTDEVYSDEDAIKTKVLNNKNSTKKEFDVFNDDVFSDEEKPLPIPLVQKEEPSIINENVRVQPQQFVETPSYDAYNDFLEDSSEDVVEPTLDEETYIREHEIPEDFKKEISNSSNDIEVEDVHEISNKTCQFAEDQFDVIDEEESQEIPTYNYKLPPLSLLNDAAYCDTSSNQEQAEIKKIQLNSKLRNLGINGQAIGYKVAPAFTRFEVQVQSDVKINQIPSVKNDLMMALSATKINILAPIPGTPYVGIDIPNVQRSLVTFKECFLGIGYDKKDNKCMVTLGKDITGKVINIALNEAPHLLVAGATGSGKSVCLNVIITSLIMRAYPNEVGLVLVDPKKVEFSQYATVPHLICPVITDIKKASVALKRMCEEMDRRYQMLEDNGCRNIEIYNKKMESLGKPKLKYIVVIIDEFADLILQDKGNVEESIRRITSMARTAGIHLIVATQRPSVDVITGVIKTNIPSRIAFAVASNTDSRVILDETGAEELLGKGDMLVKYAGTLSTQRIQNCLVTDEEIDKIVEYLAKQTHAYYDENFLNLEEKTPEQIRFEEMGNIDKNSDDILYKKILNYLHCVDSVSVSILRRKYTLGQPRAARMIDRLEEDGFIGPAENNKPRVVYRTALPDIYDLSENESE